MKFCEIAFSPTGGTKKAADILFHGLTDQDLEFDLCDRNVDFSKIGFNEKDVVLIAVPSYGGRVPQTAIDRLGAVSGGNARAVLVCVYGNRAYDNTLAELLDVSLKAGFRPVAALAEHSIVRKVAAGRPDAEDEKKLREMTVQIGRKLAGTDDSLPLVPGKIPEKAGHKIPGMAPDASEAGEPVGTYGGTKTHNNTISDDGKYIYDRDFKPDAQPGEVLEITGQF